MTKYNSLFKQPVMEFYLQDVKTRSPTHKHFQLIRRTLRHWINQFKCDNTLNRILSKLIILN